MISLKTKDTLIILLLMFLVGFLFFNSFKRNHRLFYDEFIFYYLALETEKSPTQYTTKNLLQLSLKTTPDFPWDAFWAKSLNAPVFKIPPMFADIIRPFFKIFGTSMQTCYYVTLIFYLAMIPCIYLLANTLFGRNTALLAACLMTIEPVMSITSQKIVSDVPLAFFSTLSFYLYARTIKNFNPLLTICAGICAGFAFLTKYPGLLITLSIFCYALMAQRQLFTKKSFWISLCIPLLMSLPWFIFNYNVYGNELFEQNHQIASLFIKFTSLMTTMRWPLILILLFLIIFKKKLENNSHPWNVLLIIGFLTLIPLLIPHLLNSFDLGFLPKGGCQAMGMFRREPWHFYLNQLIELSPFYIFTILSLGIIFFDTKYKKEYVFLLTCSIVILTFFIFWKDYQSRYITQAITPCLILSARILTFFMEQIGLMTNKRTKPWLTLGFLFIFVFCIYKTVIVDYYFYKHTNLCYY